MRTGCADDDRLIGGAGADAFVFGAEAHDGDRDLMVVKDGQDAVGSFVFTDDLFLG